MNRLKSKILIQVSAAILLVELVLLVISLDYRKREIRHSIETNPATAGLTQGDKAAVIRNDVRSYAFRIGGMIALIISGTVVLVYFRLNRLVLKPIQRLIDSNLALASGDQAGAVIREDEMPGDEIGDIMRTRQIMLDSLRYTEHELMTLNQELEIKVEERTCELQQALHELQQTNRRLIQSEKMIMMGTLTAGVIHELTQPMMALMFSLSQLDVLTNSHPEKCRLVSDVRARCQDLHDSMNSLRQFSRQSTTLHALDANKVIERVIYIIRHQLHVGRIDLKLDLAAALPLVLGDEVLIQHCLINLIANARDALVERPPQESKRITVRSRSSADEVLLEVIDNGGGMTAETLAAIKQPFFTTKPPEQGTGLGLMMVRQMLTELKGTMDVESSPGIGSRFSIHLPQASAINADSNQEAHHAA
jgi:two-component system NtrC family sensor kinase